MTISTPMTLPSDPGPRAAAWRLRSAVEVSTSPYDFQLQTHINAGARWEVEITLPKLTEAEARDWIAFLAACNGQQRSFYLGPSLFSTPSGNAGGTPLVRGASQTGSSLITDGWTGSTANILKAGDFFQVENRLYMNLQNVSTNSGGEATLDISPPLRSSPADNAPITTSSPKGIFVLESSNVPIMTLDAQKMVSIAFKAVESL